MAAYLTKIQLKDTKRSVNRTFVALELCLTRKDLVTGSFRSRVLLLHLIVVMRCHVRCLKYGATFCQSCSPLTLGSKRSDRQYSNSQSQCFEKTC